MKLISLVQSFEWCKLASFPGYSAMNPAGYHITALLLSWFTIGYHITASLLSWFTIHENKNETFHYINFMPWRL